MSTPPKQSAPATGEGDEGKALTSCSKTKRQPCLDQVSIERHRDFIQSQSDRLECLRLIERTAGTVRHFLNTRQPALGDLTGRELLEQQPAKLLRRLRQLEEQA